MLWSTFSGLDARYASGVALAKRPDDGSIGLFPVEHLRLRGVYVVGTRREFEQIESEIWMRVDEDVREFDLGRFDAFFER